MCYWTATYVRATLYVASSGVKSAKKIKDK